MSHEMLEPLLAAVDGARKALSGNASAQTGAAQRYFPIISGLDIATFHSESACGSREASDSGVGTRTRRGCGKLENRKTLIGPGFGDSR